MDRVRALAANRNRYTQRPSDETYRIRDRAQCAVRLATDHRSGGRPFRQPNRRAIWFDCPNSLFTAECGDGFALAGISIADANVALAHGVRPTIVAFDLNDDFARSDALLTLRAN